MELKEKIIGGIQQIGIGVTDLYEAWKWYAKHFGMDIKAFEDDTIAELMLPYTGGQPQKRHAALALNLQGGGGFEIWQYTSRTPQICKKQIKIGDLGIFSAKLKSVNIFKAFEYFKNINASISNEVKKNPSGQYTFFVKDPFGNIFEICEFGEIFKNEKKYTGGIYGVIIGVLDIEKALLLYRDILGYDKILYDVTGTFDDIKVIPGGEEIIRRVCLTHSKPRYGSFSKLYGTSCIELVKCVNRNPEKIYEGRFWGDPGFIHLCYDIQGMDFLKKECNEKGFQFTVNSDIKHNIENSFDMGEASGHFSYVEDNGGTLIEFVEVHKLPIIKSLGIGINMRKRNPYKPFPSWVLKLMSVNRVKF